MGKRVEVKTGEMAIAQDNVVLTTGSIGSCVVVALYDGVSRVGGLVHAMLPSRTKETENNELSSRYVDEGIEMLVQEMKEHGGDSDRFEAKIVGGAKMFKRLSGDAHGIGYQNLQKAYEKLESMQIRLVSEEVGGRNGRIASFNLANGVMDVETKI